MTRNPQGNSRKFSNQEYFEDFNWDRLQAGDIVWLEDYRGTKSEGDLIAGIICRFDFNNPVIRVLPKRAAELLGRFEKARGEPIISVIGINSYLEGFQYR
jgi:hypothetical protein